ncbi:MAG: methyltransferase domain-containing protein [Myxococcales bacterium]|nr:methyltransferase domain-containing protein [Myxococcales bacterium]
MAGYIHGETDPREVARLEKQARFASPFILRELDATPGMRVLDLATGVGAMAQQLFERFPGVRLFALDLDRRKLSHAAAHHPGPGYVRGDASRLPFKGGAFERVHCSWLLEHLARPVEVLREVRRVLAAGGYCHLTEVDNSTFRTSPESPEVAQTLSALNTAQIAAGGDPFIGQRLEALFREAGFSRVRLIPAELRGTGDDLRFFHAFAEEFAEIFESLDEALGPKMAPTLRAAARRLRELPGTPGAEMYYRGVIGQAWR